MKAVIIIGAILIVLFLGGWFYLSSTPKPNYMPTMITQPLATPIATPSFDQAPASNSSDEAQTQ